MKCPRFSGICQSILKIIISLNFSQKIISRFFKTQIWSQSNLIQFYAKKFDGTFAEKIIKSEQKPELSFYLLKLILKQSALSNAKAV